MTKQISILSTKKLLPQQKESLLKADFDFKYHVDHELMRTHTLEIIKQIVGLYNSIIFKYLNVTPDKLNAFIFERKEPYQDKEVNKDDIHIIYPFIVCDTDIQHLIRKTSRIYRKKQ